MPSYILRTQTQLNGSNAQPS
ncbi:hypothetical protein F383_39250 [Gossypium arboreum]|uniref:Uncharacterized protein n=1 Tax=Gossypium arboreum TaxID=29729 RepID=A0A0B0MHB5_GOSAR|nr:hypothetical protein F383_39250 [Gossypium arboreum]